MQTVNSAYSLLENSGGWKVSHLISQGHSYFDTTTMNKQVNNIKTGKERQKEKDTGETTKNTCHCNEALRIADLQIKYHIRS